MVFGSQHSRTILRSQVPSTKTTGDGLNSIKNVVSFGRLARGSHIARSRMGKNGNAADITGMTESVSTSDIGAPPRERLTGCTVAPIPADSSQPVRLSCNSALAGGDQMQFDQLKRREFITLLGGAAVAWPLAARAQQPAKLPTIGFLGSPTPSVGAHWLAAFVERMRELNWIEGRTVAIEVRWAGGRSERFAEIAAEFVRLKVDVIVTSGGAVAEAKQTTSAIPIVFGLANDPVGAGLVTSLARPGGNVTGLSLQSSDLAGKRLELLREVVPALRRLAIMANIGNPSNIVEMGE